MKRATGIQVSLMIDQCTDFALFVVIHLLSHVQLFMTPWTAAHQVSLSFTISRSLLKLISIELMVTSNHLILSSLPPPALNLSQVRGLFR